jgi:hypothetical protein
MKVIVTLIIILFASPAMGQQLKGLLLGDFTRMPIVNAKVTAGKNAVLSNPSGVFNISIPPHTDSIRITAAGYQPYAFKPTGGNGKDTLVIYLNPVAYALKQVSIKGKRNLKADSVRLRKEFGAVFNYKGPTLGNIFYNRPMPNMNIPDDHITAPNNATSIIGFDLLSVASLLSKKKDKTTHLQNVLLKEEASNYTDQVFSRQKVSNLTNLKGDSLQKFMDKYRPDISRLRKMTDYELVTYIKKSYAEFTAHK